LGFILSKVVSWFSDRFKARPPVCGLLLAAVSAAPPAQRRQTLVVQDVHAFPGHIACDAASRSEIVVPLLQHGNLLGVLDLNSPELARFDDEDCDGLNACCNLLLEKSELSKFLA
jgi:L-methionine (R)-S-oxide reductase